LGTQLTESQSRGGRKKSILAGMYRLHSFGKDPESRLKHLPGLKMQTGSDCFMQKRIGVSYGGSPEIIHFQAYSKDRP
jgi:hypothetical protein